MTTKVNNPANKIEPKRTQLGENYWSDGNTAYKEEYKALYEKFVPASGAAKTLHGELIRGCSRLYYEYCNNGNCNACNVDYEDVEYSCSSCNGTGETDDGEECGDCYGSGFYHEEEMGDVAVTPFYAQFLTLINGELAKNYSPQIAVQITNGIEHIIENHPYHDGTYFNDLWMAAYDKMVDYVVAMIIATEDAPLPEWYEVD